MWGKMMEVTPHLKSVLKTYQNSATKSLQGPGLSLIPPPPSSSSSSSSSSKSSESPLDDIKDDFIDRNQTQPPPPPFPIQQLPILGSADKTCSERTETILEGETISCFIVGGEKRLCLPQVLNSVLRDFSLSQINHECDNLLIYCSRCTHEQLNVLKSHGILPSSAPSCGLITKTDAERLCSALLHGQITSSTATSTAQHRPPIHLRKGLTSFYVYHECFGKCRGNCFPEMYTTKTARCIECIDCHSWLTPQQFVCHVHRDLENRTVHWGFDSLNWRSYVLVAEDQIDHQQYVKYLDDMREQYEGKQPFPPHVEWNGNNLKRKLLLHNPANMLIKQEYVDTIPLKKNKFNNDEYPLPYNIPHLYPLDPLSLHYFKEQCLGHYRPKSTAFKSFGYSLKESKLRQAIAHNNKFNNNSNEQNNANENVIIAAAVAATTTPPTPKKFRYMKHLEKEALANEVTSSQKEVIVSNMTILNKQFDDDKNRMQKSPDSQSVIDSTTIQTTNQVSQLIQQQQQLNHQQQQHLQQLNHHHHHQHHRYNSEIELSTDTDDTASISSEKQTTAPTTTSMVVTTTHDKLEALLKNLEGDVMRESIIKYVQNLNKEYEMIIQDKDNKIRLLEAKLADVGDGGGSSSSSTTTITTTTTPPPPPPPPPPLPPPPPSECDDVNVHKRSVITSIESSSSSSSTTSISLTTTTTTTTITTNEATNIAIKSSDCCE